MPLMSENSMMLLMVHVIHVGVRSVSRYARCYIRVLPATALFVFPAVMLLHYVL